MPRPVTLPFILNKYIQKHHVSVTDLAYKINIAPSTLLYLSQGNYAKLGSFSHVSHILKKIASIFDLKYEILCHMYKTEYAQFCISLSLNSKTKADKVFSAQHISWRFLIYGIFTGGIGLYMLFQFNSLTTVPPIDFGDKSVFINTQDASYDLKGNIAGSYSLTLNGQNVTIDKSGNFDINLDLNSGYNILNFKIDNKKGYNRTVKKIIYLHK